MISGEEFEGIVTNGRLFRTNDDGDRLEIVPSLVKKTTFRQSDFAYLPNCNVLNGDNYSRESLEWLAWEEKQLPSDHTIRTAMSAHD